MNTDITIMNRVNGLQLLFGQNHDDWQYTESILSSVTPRMVSEKVAEICHQIYQTTHPAQTPQTLWDPFGGTGLDTVSFSKYYDTITTELDAELFECLRQNVTRFHASDHRYEVLCADATVYRPTRTVDLIYLDPPWGETFRTGEVFDLMQIKLQNQTSVMDYIEDLRQHVTKNMIIKSPIKNDNFREVWGDRVKWEVQFEKFRLKFFYLT